MKILCVGDVVGSIGCRFLRSRLPRLKREKAIDAVVVNGENSADGNGITPDSAEDLFASGADVITTGNHVFRRKEIYSMLEEHAFLLRPANFPASAPGRGVCILDRGKYQIGVINLMGTAFMENLRSPFETMDQLLRETELPKTVILDFHAEATGEKRALAFYLDGKLSAVFGTHTHVPTADETILPNGTGYLTDVGMTGPIFSVLGVKPEQVIEKYRSHMPVRFSVPEGDCRMDAVLFEIDEKTGKTRSVERLNLF